MNPTQRKRKPAPKRFLELKIVEAGLQEFGEKQTIFQGKANMDRKKQVQELFNEAEHKGMNHYKKKK